MSFGDTAARHYRRNAFLLTAGNIWFGVGLAFVSLSTVLPSFVRQLTDSTVLVGLATTVMRGGWFLPQLLAASWVRRHTTKKPLVIGPAMIGRPTFWVTAVATVLFADRNPGLVRTVFLVGILLFALTDGVSSVSWFEIVAKCIPLERRGRILGKAQVVVGIVSLGISATIAYLLGSASPLGFPRNYALLFFLSGLAFTFSTLTIALIREPVGEAESTETQRPGYLHLLRHILSHDRTFVGLVASRLLLDYAGMAQPFFVLHATEVRAISAQTIGLFVLAETGARILGGTTLGYLSERRGSAAVVRASNLLGLSIPVLALVAHALPTTLGGIPLFIYVVLFLAIGLLRSSFMLGYIARYLEIAPEQERAVYMGLANTLNALTLPATLIGGWILQETTYPTLFFIAVGCAIVSTSLSFRTAGDR
jgi:predicted MFS family arabinose efflux permease